MLGVSVGEPLGLRLAGGGRAWAIVTGLDQGESGSALLVPPAPRAVVHRAAGAVLRTPGPLDAPLDRARPAGPDPALHPRGRRRRSLVLLVAALLVAARWTCRSGCRRSPRSACRSRSRWPPTAPARSGTRWSTATSWSAPAA